MEPKKESEQIVDEEMDGNSNDIYFLSRGGIARFPDMPSISPTWKLGTTPLSDEEKNIFSPRDKEPGEDEL